MHFCESSSGSGVVVAITQTGRLALRLHPLFSCPVQVVNTLPGASAISMPNGCIANFLIKMILFAFLLLTFLNPYVNSFMSSVVSWTCEHRGSGSESAQRDW